MASPALSSTASRRRSRCCRSVMALDRREVRNVSSGVYRGANGQELRRHISVATVDSDRDDTATVPPLAVEGDMQALRGRWLLSA